MSIKIGDKVKVRDELAQEGDYYAGAKGTVIAECDFGWEWVVEIDSEAEMELGYDTDELEVVK